MCKNLSITFPLILSLILLNITYGKTQQIFKQSNQNIPIVVITDTYHPYQDPGDNLDLINGFAIPGVDLKAIVLDITDSFRKPLADHPTLWNDPRGPREAGIIPVMQLNYIFDKNVPWALSPMSPMENEFDTMESIPAIEQQGIELLLNILKQSDGPIEILSFGSARTLAVAYNRNPSLMKEKISQIYLSAGTASENYRLGKDGGANSIPGGEWNVALDVFAFRRLLHSDLPIAIFPCAGIDGGFVKDKNNTYWEMPNMGFISTLNIKLQRYLNYAFTSQLQHDFLRAMDIGDPVPENLHKYPKPFHIWETPIWLIAGRYKLVSRQNKGFRIIKDNELLPSDKVINNSIEPCLITVRDDGRFLFELTDAPTNFSIFTRDNLAQHEMALQEALPHLLGGYLVKNRN